MLAVHVLLACDVWEGLLYCFREVCGVHTHETPSLHTGQYCRHSTGYIAAHVLALHASSMAESGL